MDRDRVENELEGGRLADVTFLRRRSRHRLEALEVVAVGAAVLVDRHAPLRIVGRLAAPGLALQRLAVAGRVLEGGEDIPLGDTTIHVEYTPGHASHHVSYFDDSNRVAFIGDTGGIHIDNGPFILPATPPPDIDLEIWDKSFATILGRKPERLFLTHFGYSEDPAKDLSAYRERLHRWCALAEEVLRTEANDDAALATFVAKCRGEMEATLGKIEAEHHAFTGGLDLSFLGLARYRRKRDKTAAEAKSQAG